MLSLSTNIGENKKRSRLDRLNVDYVNEIFMESMVCYARSGSEGKRRYDYPYSIEIKWNKILNNSF